MSKELEEAAKRLQKDKYGIFISKDADVKGQLVINTARAAFLSGMKEGANYQAEKMYSEQIELINWLQQSLTSKKFYSTDAEDLIEQLKKKIV